VLPGGYGTLDELFEALVLVQTHKIRAFPVMLVGTEFWGPMVDWIGSRLLEDGLIGPEDPGLVHLTDDPGEACDLVCAAADAQGRPERTG
jgi:predicted Rossmann-fold nucleotide-binding protein